MAMKIAYSSQAPLPRQEAQGREPAAEKAASREKSLAGNFGFGTKLINRVVGL
jgi:hypothetical protein